MTIMATHFSLVLGAWRLRVRIDLDEPRESQLDDERAAAHDGAPRNGGAHAGAPHTVTTWGRG